MTKQPKAVDIKVELRVHIARKYKTQKAAATAWGCSAEYVSMVLAGRKPPTLKMLDDAGFYLVRSPVKYYKDENAKE